MTGWALVLVLLLALPIASAAADPSPAGAAAGSDVEQQLVFGSFRSRDNAHRWAAQLTQRFRQPFHVERVHREDGSWFRVRSENLTPTQRAGLEAAARAQGLSVWVIRGAIDSPGTITATTPAEVVSAIPDHLEGPPGARASDPAPVTPATRASAMPAVAERAGPVQERTVSGYTDFDVGLQTRAFRQDGLHGQGRLQPSLSARMQLHRSWDDGRSSVTFTPFVRIDAEDDERTHADVRELFWTRVGDDWELHVGARQIFWGVTEFHHLVDIINQTDLVENVNAEAKLGQPMVQLSLIRDWGMLDLFLLTGFRERTFPGEDGRLRGAVPIDTDAARYDSGAGPRRVDGAVRWSHHLGPVSFGLYHFSGTSRDPRLVPEARPESGAVVLVPEYHVIDQTGLDAQAIVGDWAWKLETISRSGQGGGRYQAFTAGFERTVVGALGSRADLGLVAEYMYDQRGRDAFDTLFENDVALGARWRANDVADSTALLGVIWDVRSREYIMTLEASRQIGSSWTAVLEGRLFGGAEPLDPAAPLPQLFDPRYKTRPLQRDDFVQLELTRYF